MKKDYSYYFRNHNILFYFVLFPFSFYSISGCIENNSNEISLNEINFEYTWMNDLKKSNCKCSNNGLADNKKVINFIDSIITSKKIKLQNIEISKWQFDNTIIIFRNPKVLRFYDVCLNKNYCLRVEFDKLNNTTKLANLDEIKVKPDSYDNSILKLSYVEYSFNNSTSKLINVFSYCKPKKD